MEKKNGLYYFESYDEIRQYAINGFPQEIYLVTKRACVLRKGNVLKPNDRSAGETVPQWELNEGRVTEPEDMVHADKIGELEDFQPYEYAVRCVLVRKDIIAGTMLDGLYAAAEHLCPMLHTPDSEQRTVFTSSDLIKPIGKGGVVLDYPQEEPLYCITSQEGTYKVRASVLFEIICRAEKAMSAGNAKRRRFTILHQNETDKKVLMRMTFQPDKFLPKLKSCWATDELRLSLTTPAIDVNSGIITATDGRILAMHKLQGYQCEKVDMPQLMKRTVYELEDQVRINVPRETVSMKGAITIQVTEDEWKENGSEFKGIRTTATDSTGKTAFVHQSMRYPNWKAVLPTKKGVVQPIDENFSSAVKQVSATITKDSSDGEKKIALDVLPYENYIHLTRRSLYEDTAIKAQAKLPQPASEGILVALSATLVKSALSFEPTAMVYRGAVYPVVWLAGDTRILTMPMNIRDDYTPRSSNASDYYQGSSPGSSSWRELPDDDTKEWLTTPASSIATPKKAVKAKRAAHKASVSAASAPAAVPAALAEGSSQLTNPAASASGAASTVRDASPSGSQRLTFSQLLRQVLLAA